MSVDKGYLVKECRTLLSSSVNAEHADHKILKEAVAFSQWLHRILTLYRCIITCILMLFMTKSDNTVISFSISQLGAEC